MLCLQSHFRMDQAFFLINFYSRVVAFLCCDSFYCTANISASQVALVVKNPPGNAGDIRDAGLTPGSGRFPQRRAWQPTPIFLPGESHG